MPIIRVQCNQGKPLDAVVTVTLATGDPKDAKDYRTNDKAQVKIPSKSIRHLRRYGLVFPRKEGYWPSYIEDVDAAQETVCTCAAISAIDRPWWHELLGTAADSPERGAGVTIGVVDRAFKADDALDRVRFVGDMPWAPPKRTHGDFVARLLSDRGAPKSCSPVAIGSEILFADASFILDEFDDGGRLPPGVSRQDAGHYIDPRRVAGAIFELALNTEVDIITLSLGVYDEAINDEGVADAIAEALDCGVVVVCAAGNLPGPAAFPARLETCVGVGAFGSIEWTPEGSIARDRDIASPNGLGTWRTHDLHHWCQSAYGDGVDLIGPGVGILVAYNGCPAVDLSGTSFATPIVAGMLAVELSQDLDYVGMPRSRARADYARNRLFDLCVRTGMDPELEGRGLFGPANGPLSSKPYRALNTSGLG